MARECVETKLFPLFDDKGKNLSNVVGWVCINCGWYSPYIWIGGWDEWWKEYKEKMKNDKNTN